VVAAGGMIGTATVAALEKRKLLYLPLHPQRTDKAMRDLLLADTALCVPLTITKRGHRSAPRCGPAI
jgi:hypothetical protein